MTLVYSSLRVLYNQNKKDKRLKPGHCFELAYIFNNSGQ